MPFSVNEVTICVCDIKKKRIIYWLYFQVIYTNNRPLYIVIKYMWHLCYARQNLNWIELANIKTHLLLRGFPVNSYSMYLNGALLTTLIQMTEYLSTWPGTKISYSLSTNHSKMNAQLLDQSRLHSVMVWYIETRKIKYWVTSHSHV